MSRSRTPGAVARPHQIGFTRKAVDGLGLSYVGVDEIQIATGIARDDNDSYNIELIATQNVELDNGTGINKLDTGSPANDTFYSVWVVSGPTGTGGLLSTSATSPTLPAGYNVSKRRIGWIRNDGSGNLYKFIQHGVARHRIYDWNMDKTDDLTALSNGSAASWTDIALGAWIPSTATNAYCHFLASAGGNWVEFRPDGWDAGHENSVSVRNDAARGQVCWIRCPGQIIEYYRGSDASSRGYLFVLGFEDLI